MAPASGSVPFAIDGQSLSQVEQASKSVGGPLGVETILLLMGLAVVAVGILGILTYLYSARETVDREIEEVEAEREAFLAFADRIEGMTVEQTATAMATPQTIQTFDTSGPPVHEVADAFEDTVMALPHYEETYGNDVVAQMATELDADLVASLHRQGSMSETVKRGLQQQANDAAAKRADLLVALKAERDSLAEADGDLRTITRQVREMNGAPLGEIPYDQLSAYHDELGALHERVEALIRTRQRDIRNHARSPRGESESVTLQEYLYGTDGTTYPVLKAGSQLDQLLDRAKARIRRAVWSRA